MYVEFEEMMNALKGVTDLYSKRLKEMEIEQLRTISFIKSVLYANKLSNEDQYKDYVREWNKLNQHIIDCSDKEWDKTGLNN